MLLLYELWVHSKPDLKYFHALHCLPEYLNHSANFSLTTLFSVAGINPNIPREDFIDVRIKGKWHHPLYDAKIVRECFRKLLDFDELKNIKDAVFKKNKVRV